MQLGGYFAVLRRWWLTIAAAVVMATLGASIVVSQVPKTYEAEVRILVGPLNTDLETQRAAGQLANTYAQIVTSQRLTEAAIRRVGVDLQPAELQEAMSAVPNDVTRLVTIRVQNGDADTAASLANAVAEELAALGREAGRPEGEIQVIDPAEAIEDPVAPQVTLVVLLAAFSGLLVALSAVVLVDYARGSIRSEDELVELSGAPVLGRLTTRLGRRDFASAVLGTERGDAYRAMTARIEHSLGKRRLRSLLVTSTVPDGAGPVLSAGLALAFADRGLSTALVDAGRHTPDASEALGLSSGAEFDIGTSDGHYRLSRVSVVVEERKRTPPRAVGLTVAAAETARELARTEQMEAVLDGLLDDSEIVVISAPPVGRSPEALLWAQTVDAIVLVVPLPGASRDDVSASTDAVRLVGAQLLGTIVTEAGTAWPPRSVRPAETTGHGTALASNAGSGVALGTGAGIRQSRRRRR